MLVDDHASFREPLAVMLAREPDMIVIAQAGSLVQARKILLDDPPVDVAVVDLGLSDGDGTDLIRELREARREAVSLVLSSYSERARLARAIEAGAAGTIHKSSRLAEIVDAVRRLHAGESLLSQREVMEALRLLARERREDQETRLKIGSLSRREREVLQVLAEGLSDAEIAERLYVGVGTVRAHLTSINVKLGVASRLQALVFAVRHGLVDLR